ncbi:MAG TPA: glycosyltransferase [Patescibacteria group bacterium]|nr:glycosyltransferase [Patescibacteria group bacterium]
MQLSWELLYATLLFLAVLGCIGLGVLIFFKLRHQRWEHKKTELLQYLAQELNGGHPRRLLSFASSHPKIALRLLLELSQSIVVNQESHRHLITLICSTGIEAYYLRRLQSPNARKRMDAALHLSALPTGNTCLALTQALRRETLSNVKLHLCSALVDVGHHEAIPDILRTLPGAPQWYRTRVNMLLVDFGDYLRPHIPSLLTGTEPEIESLVVDIAPFYPSEEMHQYLLAKAAQSRPDIRYRSVRILGQLYPRELASPLFFGNTNPIIRNIAIDSCIHTPTEEVASSLIPLLADPRHHDHAVASLSNMMQSNPRLLEFFIKQFAVAPPQLRNSLATVLSLRMDYLLLRLLTNQGATVRPLVEEIIRQGKTSGLIGFLNRNRHLEMENEILDMLRPMIGESAGLRRDIRQHLQPRLLEKLGENPFHPPTVPRNPEIEKDKLIRLLLLLPVAFLTSPLLYSLLHWQEWVGWDGITHLRQFVLDFNYFLAFYSLSINGTYLLLLLFSWLCMSNQAHLWRLKKQTFLFKPRSVPSISVIAPAYQEEATIVDSVQSLLSLHYPNYELIIVNDGSTDHTLHRLIAEFQLEKVDAVIPVRLKTRPIRGVYRNRHIPRLVVVDKDNGGKADALNTGINVSQKEYFCGIDADSLLEKDSLLKLASMIIDSPSEAVALGGNIFPVNGCTVDNGYITDYRLAKGFLPRLQTIEYLRAFRAGRLGWAWLGSLLIVSGAFGLFRKDRIIEIGGYLTSSERYKKDTVGEDMELVVRLRRHMTEIRQPCSVHYSYNASCWTEVPESLAVLHRQRDRWQRGLIDILYFHRRMLLNPRYGRTGMLAMPYFFFFEMFGPFLEVQGYIMVVLAYFLDLLDPFIACFLFIANILLGVVVSVFALAISAREFPSFSGADSLRLIGYAILENFGPRQLLSFWRVTGYWNALRQTTSWGKMTRKGFFSAPSDTPIAK